MIFSWIWCWILLISPCDTLKQQEQSGFSRSSSPVCILLQQSWLTRSIQTTTAVIHNIGRNYSFNPVLSCNREYCNNGHIFLQRNLVYLQHNPLYPCIALVHHTATIQRPRSRPGFCSINEDIKTSFLCEHGIIPIQLPYYLQNFCLMI